MWTRILSAVFFVFLLSSFQYCIVIIQPDELQEDGSRVDASIHTEEFSTVFPCGPKKTCKTATEMCVPYIPGTCTGPPPAENGVCPTGCTKMNCGRSEGTCLCIQYNCEPLPMECTHCKCIEKTPKGRTCTCSQKSGGIYLECNRP